MHIMRNPHAVPLKYACQTCTVGIKVAGFQSGPLCCFAKFENHSEELITNILPSQLQSSIFILKNAKLSGYYI